MLHEGSGRSPTRSAVTPDYLSLRARAVRSVQANCHLAVLDQPLCKTCVNPVKRYARESLVRWVPAKEGGNEARLQLLVLFRWKRVAIKAGARCAGERQVGIHRAVC